jgi:hypothetical protein
MASELSPFVLQKIQQRKDAAEKAEEADEAEEAEDEEEEAEEEAEEAAPEPRKKSHHAIGERSSHGSGSRSGSRSSSGSLTDRAQKFIKNLGPAQTVMLIGGGLLLANHLMVPRGTSVLSQILNAVAPAPKARPRPSYYSGANFGAGWNRGNKPFGPWAHASPGGPSPYAHGDSWRW